MFSVKQEPSSDYLLVLDSRSTPLEVLQPKVELEELVYSTDNNVRQPIGVEKFFENTMRPIVKLQKFNRKWRSDDADIEMFDEFSKCGYCDYVTWNNNLHNHFQFCKPWHFSMAQNFQSNLRKKEIVSYKFVEDIPELIELNKLLKTKSEPKAKKTPEMKTEPKEVHRCHRCGKCFPYQRDLNQHLKRATAIRCEKCEMDFWCQKLFDDHIKDIHDNKFECEMCPEWFDTRKRLSKHKRRHRFICKTCDKSFTAYKNLNYHQMRYQHGTYETRPSVQFGCDECDKWFISEAILGYHKNNVHVRDELKTCQMCHRVSTSITALKKHRCGSSHFGLRQKGIFECDLCDLKFNYKTTIRTHIKTVHKNGLYCCSLCRKKFISVHHLSSHRKIHISKGVYKCFKCDYKKSALCHIVDHVRKTHKMNLNHMLSNLLI